MSSQDQHVLKKCLTYLADVLNEGNNIDFKKCNYDRSMGSKNLNKKTGVGNNFKQKRQQIKHR